MSIRVDTSSLIHGSLLVGNRGLGVLGSTVPSVGNSGAGYLYNDLNLPADADKEVRGLILTQPGAGALYTYEDSSFDFTGAPDGNYTFTYRLYVDGVDSGTGTVNLQIVSTPISVSVTTSYNLRGSISSDKSSAFNVRGLVDNSLGIVYNLRGSAYADSLNNYTVLSASSVSAAVTAVYNLRNLVNNTISSSFNINSSVAQSILDEYKVRTSALSNNSNSYNIRGNVLRDIISNYQINPAVQYVYSDLNCYYNIITSMISPSEVARVKIYPSRLITTYDVERVKRIIA